MDIVTLGELLVDMFPSEVGLKLVEVPAFHPKPGGAPANVAVAATRLGAKSAFIGKVGEDFFGHHLRDVLAEEGVETRGIRFDDEARTTMAIIAKPDENTAEFVFYRNPGADQRLRVDELDEEILKRTKVFHFGSLSLTDEPIRSATYRAIELAQEGGALISYDVNYRPDLWKDPREALAQAMALVPKVNLLKVNEGELALLAEQEDLDPSDHEAIDAAARVLLEQGPELVIVTLGSNGSYFRVPEGGTHVKPFKVDTVDAVGCGDSFCAGLLTQLVRSGKDWHDRLTPDQLREILRYANAVGALTSMTKGVIPALPTADRVDAFLKQQA